MKGYIVSCDYRCFNEIFHTVKEKTQHWELKPLIYRSKKIIQLGMLTIVLATSDTDYIGRRNLKQISLLEFYEILDYFNVVLDSQKS